MQVSGTLTATLGDGTSKTYEIGSLSELQLALAQMEAVNAAVAKYGLVDAFINECVVITGDSDDQVHGSELSKEFEHWKFRKADRSNSSGKNLLYERLRNRPKVYVLRPKNVTVFSGVRLVGLPTEKTNPSENEDLI